MLRGAGQHHGTVLSVAGQAATGITLGQPPGQDGRTIGTPQRQTRPLQSRIGADRIKLHQQGISLIAVLTDHLLRILAQFGQPGILHGRRRTGQTQHQGIQGARQGGTALLRLLPAHGLAHLIQVGDGLRPGGRSQQSKAEEERAEDGAHKALAGQDGGKAHTLNSPPPCGNRGRRLFWPLAGKPDKIARLADRGPCARSTTEFPRKGLDL